MHLAYTCTLCSLCQNMSPQCVVAQLTWSEGPMTQCLGSSKWPSQKNYLRLSHICLSLGDRERLKDNSWHIRQLSENRKKKTLKSWNVPPTSCSLTALPSSVRYWPEREKEWVGHRQGFGCVPLCSRDRAVSIRGIVNVGLPGLIVNKINLI